MNRPAPPPLVYLDHAATTPVRSEVLEVMGPFLSGRFGNPSGAHRLARDARRALDEAREEAAAALGAHPGEVVFTSGGTEADNLAVLGVVAAAPGRTAVCSAIEHHAVLDAVESAGGSTVAVDERGVLDLADLERVLADAGAAVALVSVMAVNNEVGTVQPLAAVAEVVRRVAPGAALHSDAVQAARYLDLPALTAPCRLVTVTAHKIGGPKGIGALVVRDGTPLVARALGGGQERDRRSGTNDVAGAAGLARALSLAAQERDDAAVHVAKLRDCLVDGLRAAVVGLIETAAPDGERAHLVPGTAHVCIPGVDSEALVFLLDEAGICASAAASCASGAQQASHVLAAMGVPDAVARGSLRLTLGPDSTDADVDAALEAVPAAVDQLRGAS